MSPTRHTPAHLPISVPVQTALPAFAYWNMSGSYTVCHNTKTLACHMIGPNSGQIKALVIMSKILRETKYLSSEKH